MQFAFLFLIFGYLEERSVNMARNEDLFNGICKGDRDVVKEIVQKVVDAEGDVVDLLNNSMIPAMRKIAKMGVIISRGIPIIW